MEIKASLQHLRMSAQKVRLVAALVRKTEITKALTQLRFCNKLAAGPMTKLIKSAVANAVNNYDLDANNLMVKSVMVDEGVTLKRWMPRAHGRATAIRKRACHINLVLAEIVDSGKKEAKKAIIDRPVKLEDLSKPKQEIKPEKVDKKIAKTESDEEKGIEAKAGTAKGGHARIEGKAHDKAFSSRIFRRKSG